MSILFQKMLKFQQKYAKTICFIDVNTEDGHLAMKFINMVKIYYDIHTYNKKA